jgi:hypothetical protein
MVLLQDSIRSAPEDDQKFEINKSFQELMHQIVNTEGAFDYPFSKISTMSILKSPDELFRLFNWNVSRNDETHVYYCIILVQDPKTGYCEWYELTDQEEHLDGITSKYLEIDQWLGCLYYEIIPVGKKKAKKTYTMLGWDGNNRYTTKKIIEAMTFERNGPRLGAPIFRAKKGTLKRVVLEYSSEVMVTLKWNAKEKRIIFDHLSPRDSSMEGIYSFYGPDFTYDSYTLDKNKWVFGEKVEVTLDRNQSTKEYNDPRNR